LINATGRDASVWDCREWCARKVGYGGGPRGLWGVAGEYPPVDRHILDNLEAGSRDRTLDQGQKRLLSSTGARLLRLWRAVLREGWSQRIADDFGRIEGLEEAKDE